MQSSLGAVDPPDAEADEGRAEELHGRQVFAEEQPARWR